MKMTGSTPSIIASQAKSSSRRRATHATIRKDAWDAAHGRPGRGFPSDKEVTYLGSDIVPANTTKMIGTLMGKGDQAIACLKPYDGGGPRERFRPSGLAGPIHVR
jgi:hypothetical protein